MDEQAIVKEVSTPLFQGKFWLKLLGILSIIEGVLSAITIVGIVIAWLPIWLGVLLFQTASNIELAQKEGNKDKLLIAQQKVKLFFTISGILMLILIIGGILTFLLGGLGLLMGGLTGGGGMQELNM